MTDTVNKFARTINSPFNEENLTFRSHIDPDKHWIGEALPAGSDAETTASGIDSSAGHSPFPARADHSHDHKTYYGVYNRAGGLAVPPGQTFISGLNFFSGRNMLAPASTQVILFPLEGVWETTVSLWITRDGGGIFTGEFNLVFWYTNGTAARTVYRTSTANIPTELYVTGKDSAHYFTSDNTTNVQVAIQHNDSVSWTANVQYFGVERQYSTGSA
jgi:hypothetical protein